MRPRIYEDGDSVSLQFQVGEIQSEMLASNPNFLVLAYTRTIASFLLLHPEPQHIAMIGLGGGSMPKWCYHHLPATEITVIEISPHIISLREQFRVPADSARFRILCGDGADYVATTEDAPDVLLVDGFDNDGQPPQLCSEQFYQNCYRALAADALMLVNLCGSEAEDRQSIDQIQRTFHHRVWIAIPKSGNKVVAAVKGKRHSMQDMPIEELVKGFRDDKVLTPSPFQY